MEFTIDTEKKKSERKELKTPISINLSLISNEAGRDS